MFVYVTTIKGVNKSSILIGLISKQESSQKQGIISWILSSIFSNLR